MKDKATGERPGGEGVRRGGEYDNLGRTQMREDQQGKQHNFRRTRPTQEEEKKEEDEENIIENSISSR